MDRKEMEKRLEEIKKRKEEEQKKIKESDQRIMKIIERAERGLVSEKEQWKDIRWIYSYIYPEVKGCFGGKKEILSESKVIYYEYLTRIIQWKREKEKGLNVPFPELEDFLSQKRDALKHKEELRRARGPSEEEEEEEIKFEDIRAKEPYWDEEEGVLKEREVSMPLKVRGKWKARPTGSPPPFPEDKLDTALIKYISTHTSLLEKVLYAEEPPHFIKHYQYHKECVSIYKTAKEKKVSWRKLKHTLEQIKFLIEESFWRRGNLINKPLFEEIFPIIRIFWKEEDNYRGWIQLLKEKYTKSGASKFIKRKIDNGIVPPYYFDVVPPKKDYLSHLISRKKQPVELPKGIWREGEDRPLTHKEIKKLLKIRFLLIRGIIPTTTLQRKNNVN